MTAQGDTARSITWYTTQMHRDTTVGFGLNVTVYSKTGTELSTFGLTVPPLTNTEAYINGIDNFVMYLNPRFAKP